MRLREDGLPPAVRSFAVLAAFGLGLWILHHELAGLHPHEMLARARSVPLGSLAAASGLTILSFVILTGYDVLGLAYAGARLSYAKIAFVSTTAFALSQGLGFTVVTGTSVRYRLYPALGISGTQVASVIVFYAVSFWLGLCVVLGGILLIEPGVVTGALHATPAIGRASGAALWAVAVAYVVWAGRRPSPLRLGSLAFSPPAVPVAVTQLLIGPLDWLACSAVLYVLLPAGTVPFTAFLGAFVAGHFIGVLSHVPGGLGVFEATMVLLLGSHLDAPTLLGAILVYRGIYYVVPLTVASTVLALHEGSRQRERIDAASRRLASLAVPVLPAVAATATFAAGAFLLISGVFPAEAARVDALVRWLPLSTLELSHVVSSLVGMLLILLAWGLRARLDRAYRLTVGLLAAGVPSALLRGLDFEVSLALLAALALVISARKQFFRRASLRSDPPSTGWVVGAGVMLGLALWLGALEYRSGPWATELWLQFAPGGDAARFARGTLAALASFGVASFAWLLRPAPPKWTRAPDEPDRVARIVAASPAAYAALALLGDKRFLFSESGDTFLMYGVEGRTWVALGDPVGPEEEWQDVLWRFLEQTHEYDDHPAFYEIGPRNLNLYAELGLAIFKLGEEARVPLTDFSLEGSRRKDLRRALRVIEREGCTFEVLPAGQGPPLLAALRAVSDEWLGGKDAAEKGFSLGSFDEAYLSRFQIAVVRREGRILAFSNLCEGAGRSEIAPDLMRFRAEAPNGMMDYLFTRLMLWGHQSGYGCLNLGMAPLSGLDQHPLAPAWERMGGLLYRHGQRFYGFEGLRAYKEKFDPVWVPKYLATRAGLALPRILANITTLIAGGTRAVFRR